MSQERDTHFQHFAEMEFRDLTPELADYLQALSMDNHPAMHRHQEALKRILAQRAYDLVYFLLDKAEYHSGSFDTGWGAPDEIHETISFLPDMDKWPE